MPAVASAGAPPGEIATRPDGAATSVSSPLSTISAFARSAAARAWCRRARPISSASTSSSRASSPACGVRIVGQRRPRSSSTRPAMAFSPSASITSGTSIRWTSSRASACAPGLRPSPGPSTTASARATAATAASIASGVSAPSASGRPLNITSSRRVVNESSALAAAATVT